MTRGRPPSQRPPNHRPPLARFAVRIPQSLNEDMDLYLLTHRDRELSKDRLVATAVAAYLHKPQTDALMYRRLDRIQQRQEDITRRLDTFGQLFLEYLFHWFRLWPDIPAEKAHHRRARAHDLLSKFVTTLHRALTDPSAVEFDVLDPDSIRAFVRSRSSQATDASPLATSVANGDHKTPMLSSATPVANGGHRDLTEGDLNDDHSLLKH